MLGKQFLTSIVLGTYLLAGLINLSPARAEEPALEQVLDDLSHGTTEIALRGIREVQRRPRDPQQVIPKLIELLDDERKITGERARWGIETEARFALLGYGNDAVPFLIRHFEQGNGNFRRAILWVFQRIGQPLANSAATTISEAFHVEQDEWLRARLLEIYGELEDDPLRLEQVVRKALIDDSVQVLGEAIRIAGKHRLPNPEIIKRLITAIDDDRNFAMVHIPNSNVIESIRQLAIESLGRIGPAAIAAEEKLQPHLAPDGSTLGIDLSAAFAIYRITEEDKMLQLLIEAAKNTNSPSRFYTAIRLLGEIGPAAAAILPLLVDEATLDKAAEEAAAKQEHTRFAKTLRRRAAIRAAIQIGREDVASLVRKTLQSSVGGDRRTAAETLSEQGPSAAPYIPQLIDALHDERGSLPDFTIIAAADALGAIGPEAKAAIEPLQTIVDTEHTSSQLTVKAAAARALAKIRIP